MSTITQTVRSGRPRGLSLLAIRFGMQLVVWGRRRARTDAGHVAFEAESTGVRRERELARHAAERERERALAQSRMIIR